MSKVLNFYICSQLSPYNAWSLNISFLNVFFSEFAAAQYYGKEIGTFAGGNNGEATQHGLQGTVYAIDSHRIWIVGFSYDGSAPGTVLKSI